MIVYNIGTKMYFRLLAFGYFLVLVSANGQDKTPNPGAVSALKTILSDYDTINGGSTRNSDLQTCSNSNCCLLYTSDAADE